MPRRARLRVAGLPLHIIQRGNNRAPCFYADEDYGLYLHHLAQLASKFECAVHAYVLMTNHVHLLLTAGKEDGPSLLMKHLGQRYVQYVNKTYRRSGTLWEGRFRSSIVQRDGYALKCQRYIELNPVRASMVKHPGEYGAPFVRLREMVAGNKELSKKLDELERRVSHHDDAITHIVKAIRELAIPPEPKPKRRIGFVPGD